jgi:hypothetical protein
MFQFEACAPVDPPTPVKPPVGASPVLSHRAFLAWGEHCQECAAPACYQTCDLHLPTPSQKCRRFTDGIVRNASAGGLPAAEIRFGKWAKLEAEGNAAMLPAALVGLCERVFVALSAPVTRLGRLAHKIGAHPRWMHVEELLHKRMNARFQAVRTVLRPDLFVAEITNPTDRPVALILTVTVDKRRMARTVRSDQLPPPAIVRLAVPPGFSRHEHDVGAMVPVLESGLPFNLAIVPDGDQTAHLIFHRLDLGVRAAALAASR